MDGAVLDGKIVAFYVAGAGGVDLGEAADRAGDVRIGGAALFEAKVFYVDGSFEIAGAVEIDEEMVAGDDAIDKDVAGAGCTEFIEGGETYIGLYLYVPAGPFAVVEGYP